MSITLRDEYIYKDRIYHEWHPLVEEFETWNHNAPFYGWLTNRDIYKSFANFMSVRGKLCPTLDSSNQLATSREDLLFWNVFKEIQFYPSLSFCIVFFASFFLFPQVYIKKNHLCFAPASRPQVCFNQVVNAQQSEKPKSIVGHSSLGSKAHDTEEIGSSLLTQNTFSPSSNKVRSPLSSKKVNNWLNKLFRPNKTVSVEGVPDKCLEINNLRKLNKTLESNLNDVETSLTAIIKRKSDSLHKVYKMRFNLKGSVLSGKLRPGGVELNQEPFFIVSSLSLQYRIWTKSYFLNIQIYPPVALARFLKDGVNFNVSIGRIFYELQKHKYNSYAPNKHAALTENSRVVSLIKKMVALDKDLEREKDESVTVSVGVNFYQANPAHAIRVAYQTDLQSPGWWTTGWAYNRDLLVTPQTVIPYIEVAFSFTDFNF